MLVSLFMVHVESLHRRPACSVMEICRGGGGGGFVVNMCSGTLFEYRLFLPRIGIKMLMLLFKVILNPLPLHACFVI